MTREYKHKLLDMIDEGLLTHEQVSDACLKFMSEDDVKQMAIVNELIED